MASHADIGLVGLGVMGRNLVLNMCDHGYTVAVFNRTYEKTVEFANSEEAAGKKVIPCSSPEEFVAAIRKPAPIMLMVRAGGAVDQTMETLWPYMTEGDIFIDGGNSLFSDTERRSGVLSSRGLRFVGAGISGGEEGARHGPSIMPGGQPEAVERIMPILKDISAKVDGQSCCTYIGSGGAGHFVKMVHNGIEYADMQLISEAYYLMKNVLVMSPLQMSSVFAEWNQGELDSYLIEITSQVLLKADAETGRPMVDMILDRAGQKGTGLWTAQTALSLGSAAPTLAEAVYARSLSSRKEERRKASGILKRPEIAAIKDETETAGILEAIREALYASKIVAYAQGFQLMQDAAREYGWALKFGEIAMIWRGGCIIRARFLQMIKDAYQRNPLLENLILDPSFTQALASAQNGWRNAVALAVKNGVSVPAFSSALAYYDAMGSEYVWANLIQAQRDYFGAHTYERIDRPGTFHSEWDSLENLE